MKITVDTNFLISATQWSYSVSHKLLRRLIEDNHEIFTTNETLSEFAEILDRDFKYEKEEIRDKVEKLIAVVKIVQVEDKINLIKRDPDDNVIIECALASLSDYVITYDKDLLDIEEYMGIKIVRPDVLLELLRK